MADEFSDETDMFKNVALFFILYTIFMVSMFSILNACIYGSEKCVQAL